MLLGFGTYLPIILTAKVKREGLSDYKGRIYIREVRHFFG